MFASELISNETPQVRLTDKVSVVLDWMDEYDVLHLPVFKGVEYQGLVSQIALMDFDEDTMLSELSHVIVDIKVVDSAHMFDIIHLMNSASLSIVPVLTADNEFLGIVRYVDIIKMLGDSAACKQPGAILELQMVSNDYSMYDVARIIEGNDAKILFANVVRSPEGRDIKLYLKLNTTDIGGVLQTFSRYDYRVKSSVRDNDYEEDLKDRFDSFMNYLNM